MRLKFQALQWQGPGGDNNVSTGSRVLINFAKGRYFGVCLKRSLKSFKFHKPWPHLCLMRWGGPDSSGKGEKGGRKPENDFHVCRLMQSRCHPAPACQHFEEEPKGLGVGGNLQTPAKPPQ